MTYMDELWSLAEERATEIWFEQVLGPGWRDAVWMLEEPPPAARNNTVDAIRRKRRRGTP